MRILDKNNIRLAMNTKCLTNVVGTKGFPYESYMEKGKKKWRKSDLQIRSISSHGEDSEQMLHNLHLIDRRLCLANYLFLRVQISKHNTAISNKATANATPPEWQTQSTKQSTSTVPCKSWDLLALGIGAAMLFYIAQIQSPLLSSHRRLFLDVPTGPLHLEWHRSRFPTQRSIRKKTQLCRRRRRCRCRRYFDQKINS
ncbi:hypothetical protein M5K25_006056 [Dendrobium thyrsiflorum]|uniref:Uncharacterized protein n=1 Tax=Dendrobium thyrsiflorum TaxID=117978 RepID=A0ABD0VAK3_DENTH